jgi:competence transcription factor ComK
MIKFYTNRAGGSPSNRRPSCGWLNSRYLNRFKAIRVELKGEFIYYVTFRCNNAWRVTLILESELK